MVASVLKSVFCETQSLQVLKWYEGDGKIPLKKIDVLKIVTLKVSTPNFVKSVRREKVQKVGDFVLSLYYFEFKLFKKVRLRASNNNCFLKQLYERILQLPTTANKI